MERPPLSKSVPGQHWLAHFGTEEVSAAEKLLNSVMLINSEEVRVVILGILELMASERTGKRKRVGLYAEREFARSKFFEMEEIPLGNKRFRRRAVGRNGPPPVKPVRGSSRVGSEGPIANLISQAVEAFPDIFVNNPGPDRIRSKARPISRMVILTDFIGSGARVTKMLDKIWAVESVKSWMSYSLIDIFVVAAAGTRNGVEKIEDHDLSPRVQVGRIAPTIYSSGTVALRRKWLELCEKYGGDDEDCLGYKSVAALVSFSYRIPNNCPSIIRGGKLVKALFSGPAPATLFEYFGMKAERALVVEASERLGFQIERSLPAEDARIVLALKAMGRRWIKGSESALAESTGLPPFDLGLIRGRAIAAGLLTEAGRLTDHGQAAVKSGISSEKKRPDIPTSLKPYYPRQLRVPGATSSARRLRERP